MCYLKFLLLSSSQLSFSLTFLWANQKLNLKTKAVYAQMREKVSDDLKFCRELRSLVSIQISANSFVNFFYEPCSEVVEVQKLMF